LPNFNFFKFKGLIIAVFVAERALVVTVVKQNEEWYLKEPIEYNGFKISSMENGVYLSNKSLNIRGVIEKYDNDISIMHCETTQELKEYLLKMLQALEYAEYLIYGD